jgi:hypothetical protein
LGCGGAGRGRGSAVGRGRDGGTRSHNVSFEMAQNAIMLPYHQDGRDIDRIERFHSLLGVSLNNIAMQGRRLRRPDESTRDILKYSRERRVVSMEQDNTAMLRALDDTLAALRQEGATARK